MRLNVTGLIALLLLVAFAAVVLAVVVIPSQASTYLSAVAAITTLALVAQTMESVRSQREALAEVLAERDAVVAPAVERVTLTDPDDSWGIGLANIGKVPAQDVRLDALEPSDWLPSKPGTSQVFLVRLLPVGESVLPIVIAPLAMGDTPEMFPPVPIRYSWWDSVHGTHSVETVLDVAPFLFPTVVVASRKPRAT
jgi:hypothetical protein